MLDRLDWNEVLHKIQSFATSDTAKEEINQVEPLSSAEQAYKKFQIINDVTEVLREETRPFMESLDFFIPWSLRLKKNATLKVSEIKDIRWFCEEALSLKETTESTTNPWTQKLQEEIINATAPISNIDSIVTPSGEIRTDASETLYQLIKEKRHLARDISKTLDRLVKDHDMESVLQDKYVTTREGRWVLPVKGGMQHQIEGIIHASSNSKQTVFMEPQNIIPINNRIRQIEIEIEEEIERLLKQLSSYLSSLLEDLQQTYKLMKESDIYFAIAHFSLLIKGNSCNFSDQQLELNSLRHPLLVFEVNHSPNTKKTIIANSVFLDQQKQILLLSGPNAGGKTVLLKSIGLAAHMARCGLPICAESDSTIPFFEDIAVAVGDSQSVDEHLSTFAAHLSILNNSLKYKGLKSLILVDEICGSTDPEEGSAIARSFINAYAENGIYGIITSHLGPLKSGWQENSKVTNGSLEYNTKKGAPTYQFLSGVAGESLAIQTAKRAGVENSIVQQAIEFLAPETRKRLQGMEDLEKIKTELISTQQSLKEERKEMNRLKSHYESLLQRLEKEKDKALEVSVQKAEKKIDHMIAHAKVDNIFRKHETLSQMKRDLPQIVKAKNKGENPLSSAQDFAHKYPPGSKVFVPNLRQDGIIQGLPNQKGLVPVMANSLRLMLPWQELTHPRSLSNSTGRVLNSQKSPLHQSPLTGGTRTVDLRGFNVEKALETLEIQLDKATLHQEDRVKIIHGHGTEALKKAVRTYLSRSLYVQKWTSSSQKNSSESGVTWAEIQSE